jgi:uncharacterized membrane protein
MATLTAWKFATPHGAENALIRPERLHDQMLTNLSDEQEAKLREAFGLEA